MVYETNRREFLKTGTAAGLGTVLGGISLADCAAQSEPLAQKIKPVSYTHLRAHETLRYLVCRLLLALEPRPTVLTVSSWQSTQLRAF